MRRKKILVRPVFVSFFLFALMSALLFTLAMSAQSHPVSVIPVDAGLRRDYSEGRVTARAGVHSAHQWAGNFEKQREKATPNPWSPVPFGPDRARQVLDLPKVSKVLARCRALGMLELPEQGFEIPKPDNGIGSGYFVVPMRNPRGDRFATAVLYREDDGNVIAITVDTATNELTGVISPDGDEELLRFNKRKWAACFMSACGPCIAGCAFTGPLWLECTGACCGVSAAVCAYLAIEQ